MKVKCIKQSGISPMVRNRLTVGKWYELVADHDIVYDVIDNDGEETTWSDLNFETLSEERNRKMKQILG
jgi:hypothetical protein